MTTKIRERQYCGNCNAYAATSHSGYPACVGVHVKEQRVRRFSGDAKLAPLKSQSRTSRYCDQTGRLHDSTTRRTPAKT
jgi:hypothetical protein